MKTKKVLKIVGIAVVVLIVAIILLVQVFGGSAVKVGVEKAGTAAMKVNVALDGASLNIFGGSMSLKGLVIDNPEGYENRHLLELENAAVDVELGSLLGDTINIEKVFVDGMTFVIEQKGLTNNLKEIMNNLPKSEGGEEEPADKDQGEGKNLKISDLELKNISVKVKLIPLPGQADTVTIKLDPIVMKDLGTEDKMSFATLTGKILTAVATGVAKQGAGLLPDDLTNSLKDITGMLGEGIKDIGKGLEDATKGLGEGAKDIGKGLEDATKGIGDGIKGLLGGKKD
ncbi:MAG: hypothetical protein KAS23_00755 [Anaerohalosphaera sp.]|nr:hypothetical protein [Anaerohalosphaera sp.]